MLQSILRLRLSLVDRCAVKRVGKPHGTKAHGGNTKTTRINDMWGTDMTTTPTVREGTAGIFFAVDRCSLELMGIHAAARGTRFEALELILQGVTRNFGSCDFAGARGLALRHVR